MQIIALVGPKGSGKTFLGRLIERELSHATFLEVEAIAMRFLRQIGGSADSFNDPSARTSFYNRVRDEIRDLASTLPADGIVIMETTGAAPETKAFLEELKQIGNVRLVRVRASASTCAARIQQRDASKQVKVSMEMIERLHSATEALDWQWDLELSNEGSVDEGEVLNRIRELLR